MWRESRRVERRDLLRSVAILQNECHLQRASWLSAFFVISLRRFFGAVTSQRYFLYEPYPANLAGLFGVRLLDKLLSLVV
jgi:hypothetical protein